MEERIHFIEKHFVDISNVDIKGKILDIGGGGEGIIGMYKGKSVVAIDNQKSELEEAAEGDYLKIIMDATDLKFLDSTFDTVTMFYMLMYAPLELRIKIFEEAFRVLKLEGELVLWDMVITENQEESKKEFYAAKVEVKLGNKYVETGYATHWNKIQNLETISTIAQNVGFKTVENKVQNNQIYIRFKKLN